MTTLSTFLYETPFGHMGLLCGAFAVLTWFLSVVTREYSWVDRLWSVAPPIYVGYVAWAAGLQDARLNLMAGLVLAWGARLTFNFARKGGYWVGGEDYRWEVLRERMSPAAFQLFNATFISPFQGLLIYLFSAPIHAAWLARGTPLSLVDGVAAGIFLLALVGETVADEQMWAFQQDKRRRRAQGEPVTEPFFRGGLYRYSRHPNYFCEMAQWWAFYLFAVAATGHLLGWTALGVVALTGLFQGSTNFTEAISLSKYPSYTHYQRTTSRLMPWFPRAARSNDETAGGTHASSGS